FCPFFFSWIFGNWYQKSKQRELVEREAAFGADPLTTLRTVPEATTDSGLLVANIIMSVSWWQGMIGGIHSIFGGTITTWDKTLSWGRQEAMQRLREQCRDSGYDSVINMRLETSEIAGSKGKTKALEIVAYGTGIKI
ncbi:uncharacterized protein METZ01_LOCUS490557, partial [marine metagenome]